MESLKLAEDILPIKSLMDFTNIPMKARILVMVHSPKDYSANTKNKTVHRSGALPVLDLIFDVHGMADIDLVDSAGATKISATCGLTEALTCSVMNAVVKYGNLIICNDTEMLEYWKWVSTQKIDNEDESLSVYIKADESITANSGALFSALCFKELTAEVLKRNKLIGTANKGYGRAIFYKASDHFIIENNPIPTVVSDNFEITLTFTHENIVANSDRTGAVDSNFSHITYDNIKYYVYSFVMTEDERNEFIKTRNSGGIPYVYRVFSTKTGYETAGKYEEPLLLAPSAILVRSLTMFYNRGTAVLGDTNHPYELDYTGGAQGVKSCLDSFLPGIKSMWEKCDGIKYPDTNGLNENPTGLEIKKYVETVQNRKDKYTNYRFLSTCGYIPIEYGPGHVYAHTDLAETRGHKFLSSSRAILKEILFLSTLANSLLVIKTYLIGHLVAVILGSGSVSLMY